MSMTQTSQPLTGFDNKIQKSNIQNIIKFKSQTNTGCGTMAYDDQNIFAKILRGEMPCQKIYEDAHSLAFLDIMPQVNGHTLVLPKTPATNILDVDEVSLAHVMATVRKIAPAIVEAMGADGFRLMQFNGAAAGQTVFHLHMHILPMGEGTWRLGGHAKLLRPWMGGWKMWLCSTPMNKSNLMAPWRGGPSKLLNHVRLAISALRRSPKGLGCGSSTLDKV